MEVSTACGFESASHFSRTYRARFGASPSRDRDVQYTIRAGAPARGILEPAARNER